MGIRTCRTVCSAAIANSLRMLGVAALLSALISIGFAQATWKQVASFSYRWLPGLPVVGFTLEIPSPYDGNGDFARIRIRVPGRQTFTLSKNDGWVTLNSPSADLLPPVRKSNLVHNDYVLLLPAQGQGRVLAFLFGRAYASSPGSLDVIELTPDGDPKLILHRNNLGFLALEDLNGDGIAEIVGYPCMSQVWGNGLETYDPLHVYQLSPTKGGKATLSLALSKTYNLRHYYGWAGPDCREDIAVVPHPPGGGKARIMKSEDAERLTSGSQQRH
jgi:hypothetical protein